jgi:hypothetical protein
MMAARLRRAEPRARSTVLRSARSRGLVALFGAVGLVVASGKRLRVVHTRLVENRPKLPACGEYENRNEPASPEQLRIDRCIRNALDQGRRAELVRTVHGRDGGQYIENLPVLGTDQIEVFVDATRDVESGPEARWSRWLCHDLRGDERIPRASWLPRDSARRPQTCSRLRTESGKGWGRPGKGR